MNKRAILLDGQDREDALTILFNKPWFKKAKWHSTRDKLWRRLEREFPEIQDYQCHISGSRGGAIYVVLDKKSDIRNTTNERV